MEKQDVGEVEHLVRDFCLEFINEINNIRETMRVFGNDITPSLPNVFNGKSIFVDAAYSLDREHVLIFFKSFGNFHYKFDTVSGDVFNHLDKTGRWKRKDKALITIDNSSVPVHLSGITTQGSKPFEVRGSTIEIVIKDMRIDIPKQGFKEIEYALVFSYPILLQRLESIKEYTRNFVKIHWDYYVQNKHKFGKSNNKTAEFKQYLENIKANMEKYFFDEKILEREIDEFIENHPVILEQSLGLIKPIYQAEMEDLLDRYGQNLKPDLIAYNQDEKIWSIVDYKRAKRNIIKNVGKVRATFKAEVHELQGQLEDYREYFNEKLQRDYFRNKYNYEIHYPSTIGIIGNVNASEEQEFNRLKQRLPRWFDVIPYNYIYDKFCRYIDLVNKLQ